MEVTDKKKVKLGFLDREYTCIFVCDVQEKFRRVMLNFDDVVSNTKRLLMGSKILDVPIVVTEQYPRGLGSTVAELELASMPVNLMVKKTQFSMVTPEVEEAMEKSLCLDGLSSVVICGMEAHVCVEQTAMELLARGLTVHVAADCCTSRTKQDRNLALQRLTQRGCYVTTYEAVLFNLLRDKEHPKFKQISQLVQDPSRDVALV
ncbi:Isochorismatase-like [Trinorchestia longiramus]|nr:Isochorismatase-like [Trinorchestia longiramus]